MPHAKDVKDAKVTDTKRPTAGCASLNGIEA